MGIGISMFMFMFIMDYRIIKQLVGLEFGGYLATEHFLSWFQNTVCPLASILSISSFFIIIHDLMRMIKSDAFCRIYLFK